MSCPPARPTHVLLVLVLTASFGCGDGGKSSAVSCDQVQTKFNACSQAVKDAFKPFCATTSDDCRQCLNGLPNVCDNTEACDPQCKKK